VKEDVTTRAGLSAYVETLKAQLAGAEARASEESPKTAQATAAFESPRPAARSDGDRASRGGGGWLA
jgi:hypothetical protein